MDSWSLQHPNCITCSGALNWERDVIVFWTNRRCTTHRHLSAHYACYRAAAEPPACRCVLEQRTQTRFPINHGDSLKCAPIWIDTTGPAERQQQQPNKQ
jgi:hypothetical protein